ncbi:MAG: phage Gp37/Gp68 family protein [Desulfurivibrionaceae bacterium]|jgi:protein gp37
MPSEKRLAKGLWWDRNWSVLEGCTPCSPACDNCFAAEYAHRFAGSLPYLRGLTNADGKWNGTVLMRQDQLDLPLRTKKPTVWFVAERSDLFHPAVSDEYLDRIFAVIALAPQHTFMVLTKRPERMAAYFRGWVDGVKTVKTSAPNIIGELRLPLPNLWLGTTIWDQASADRNIPVLLQTRAENRFVSIEPMLGPINLASHFWPQRLWKRDQVAFAEKAHEYIDCMIPMLDWVICGLESGRNARPGHPAWVRAQRDQCAAAGVPFFFKQWGEWAQCDPDSEAARSTPHSGYCSPVAHTSFAEQQRSYCYPGGKIKGERALIEDGFCYVARVGKKASGRLLDGKEHLEFPK